MLGDIDGDGYDDLAIGAPSQVLGENLYGAGTVHLFAGGPDGYSTTDSTELREFPMHSELDGFGTAISPAGDFDGDGASDFVVLAPGEDSPAAFDSTVFANPADCPQSRGNSGAAWFFLGGDGMPSAPSFVWFGRQSNAALRRVAGPLDWNGDGLDDLVFSEPGYSADGPNNRGAVFVLFGRSRDPAGVHVICAPDVQLEGLRANDQLGSAIAPLGDLDADGCDDLAVGVPGEDFAGSNGGSLKIFFGAGGTGCRQEPEVITMANSVSSDNFATAVAGGGDADGDGIPDVLVSAWNRSIGLGNELGSVWLVPGWYLTTLPPEPADGSDPSLLWPFSPEADRYQLNGWIDDERFGISVAFVPDFTDDGRAGIAVGGPTGKLGGLYDSGGVRVHSVDITAGGTWGHFVRSEPDAVLGGENHHTAGADVGRWIVGGLRDGSPILVVGGPEAHSNSISGGAAWALDLSRD